MIPKQEAMFTGHLTDDRSRHPRSKVSMFPSQPSGTRRLMFPELIEMTNLTSIAKSSHIPSLTDNILYQSNNVGGKKRVGEKQGNIVKEFTIGNTRIKINDAYCRDKTPADVQKILAGIAIRAQEQLTAQAMAKSSK